MTGLRLWSIILFPQFSHLSAQQPVDVYSQEEGERRHDSDEEEGPDARVKGTPAGDEQEQQQSVEIIRTGKETGHGQRCSKSSGKSSQKGNEAAGKGEGADDEETGPDAELLFHGRHGRGAGATSKEQHETEMAGEEPRLAGEDPALAPRPEQQSLDLLHRGHRAVRECPGCAAVVRLEEGPEQPAVELRLRVGGGGRGRHAGLRRPRDADHHLPAAGRPPGTGGGPAEKIRAPTHPGGLKNDSDQLQNIVIVF